MTTQRQPRYPSREERRAAEQATPDSTPQMDTGGATEDAATRPRSRIAEGKTPTTFHLWDETRYALHNAEWELGMNLSEIGEAAIRQYLEREGITVAEPGTGGVRRRRRKKVNGVVRG